MRRGTVTEFDEAVGLGRVVADDGAVFEFHLIEIADGTRAIDVGRSVLFDTATKLGRIEAVRIHASSTGG